MAKNDFMFLVIYNTKTDDPLLPSNTHYAVFQKELDAICFVLDQKKKNDNYGTPTCFPIPCYKTDSYAYNFIENKEADK